MNMSPDDWKLSMLISKRPRRGDTENGLRNLLVHRLRSGPKAVLRVPLSKNLDKVRRASIFCEPCGRWMGIDGDGDEYQCGECQRVYVLEFAVFSVIEPRND
jgi:hypothetical protein